MTQKLNPAQLPMEIDIDSFLDSPHSSDSDGDSNFVPNRTVYEILNQSDSSTSPSSSLRHVRPPPQFDAVEQEPQESVRPLQSDSKSEGFARAADPIWRIQSTSSSAAAPRQLPTLFGGVRSNAKPGTALAAAAAASRSFPTPHAAALKSRRWSGFLRNGVEGGEIGSSSGGENIEVCSSNGDSVGLNSERSDSFGKLDVDDYCKIAVLHAAEDDANLSRQSEDARDEIVHGRSKESQWRVSERADGNGISNDDSLLSKTKLVANLNVEQVNGSTNFDSKQTVNDMAVISFADEVIDNEITAPLVDRNSRFSSVNEVDKKNADFSAGVDRSGNLEEEVTNLDLEDEKGMQTTSDVEQGGENDDDASSTSEISELVEERIEQLESERMNKKSRKRYSSSQEAARVGGGA